MTHSYFSYALVLMVLAAYAGTTWGLGGAQLLFVQRHRWVLRECRSTPTAVQCVR